MVATTVNYFLIFIADAIFILMIINLVPFPELTTDRLRLRRLSMDDHDALQLLRSDESVNKYLERPKTTSLYETEKYIRKIDGLLDSNQSVYWAITLADENILIGAICIWHLELERDIAELGYELRPPYQGKGIMQEAVKAVIKYGFEVMQLKVITALPSAENKSSVKLLERNYFQLDLDYQYVSKEDAGEQAVYYLKIDHFFNL